MRQSQLFIPTLKEDPADADCASHKLLLRSGFIRQNASGIYSYLPLGTKVLHKIQNIVREEMADAGAQELLMPAIQPAELWHETGRWEVYGPELMRLKDRQGREFALGATHEEVITSLVRDWLNSYKKLPLAVYQIQTKYRDERRPRFGLLRGREFIMKDAYSFHQSSLSLDEQYERMYQAYKNVFTRCGLDFRAVIADSGAMGGKDTHEFMALADVGEDTIAFSDTSQYAANIEMAEVSPETAGDAAADATVVREWYRAGGQTAAVYTLQGDEVNEIKVKNLLNASMIEGFDPEKAEGDTENLQVFADFKLKGLTKAKVIDRNGDQEEADLSFEEGQYADVRMIKEGDPSPDGKGTIKFARGIEIGQIFKLGTFYSEKMDAAFLNEKGKPEPLIMGCYGIGISRTLAAIAEQHHDDDGLKWPFAVAPFHIHLITVNTKNEDQQALGEKLYADLKVKYEVLLDDRKERAGVKFAEADLIGCPVRITVGKDAADGVVEVKNRLTGEMKKVSLDELGSTLEDIMDK